ncbi:MAG TPA: hypothetical protein VFL76_10290, partial [Edaphocola sp.]|nr:hypothetical protein [Edaphocola sp.]
PVNVVSGGIKIPFMPTTNTIRVVWNGKILVWVRKACISRLEWVEDNQLVTICDGDKDKYRFGFNGQEKVNEWAGIGNHNTARFWEYDTRTAQRLNLDPEFNYSLSPYVTFDQSPIWKGDENGNIGRILTITRDERNNTSTIRLSTVNRLMTDGAQHRVWDDDASYHFENYYYDYNTIINKTIDANGKEHTSSQSYLLNSHGIKSRDAVWFGGNKSGDTKIESWSKAFSMTNFIGGVIVYGSASDNSESPGMKGFHGKILGSIDMATANDLFGLLKLASPEMPDFGAKGGEFGGLQKGLEKVFEMASDKIEEKEKTSSELLTCPTCGRKEDSAHIDDVNGKGTYNKLEKQASFKQDPGAP